MTKATKEARKGEAPGQSDAPTLATSSASAAPGVSETPSATTAPKPFDDDSNGALRRGIGTRAVIVSAVVGNFAPVRLAFAWSSVDTVPVILGQINFFLEFDVCFFRSRQHFETRPAQRTE